MVNWYPPFPGLNRLPPRWGLKEIVPVADEPITLLEARDHLRIEPYTLDSDGGYHPDDTLIEALIPAAREHCERFTGLALAIRTYELAMDYFPCGWIDLPMSPLIEVLSITYGDTSNGVVDNYVVDTYTLPGRVGPSGNSSWPQLNAELAQVKIAYRAGYGVGSDAQSLPAICRAAILLTLGHLYENREDVTDKQLYELPNGVQSLLRPVRVRTGMA